MEKQYIESNQERSFILVGCWTGIIAVIIYLSILSIGLPERVLQILAISLGPMHIVSGYGIYHFIIRDKRSIFPSFGFLFTIISGSIFTVMLITQFAVNAFVQDFKISNPDSVNDVLPAVASLGNIIQLGFDIAFDTFVSLGTLFFGIALIFIARLKWLGLAGVIISVGGLSLNLFTFPYPPAESGYFDPGPFYGLFTLILCILILLMGRKKTKGV